jgi:fatty acid desaturase
MPSCISTSEFIWREVLAFVMLWLGIICIVMGRKGHLRFGGRFGPQLKLTDRKRFAKALGLFLIAVALLIMLSTVFGWGCSVARP